MKTTLTWRKIELLQEAYTWEAFQNVMNLLSDAGKDATNATVRAKCLQAAKFCREQRSPLWSKWHDAYMRVTSALDA